MMGKGRLEAFSDGVLAIIITIMVLELRAPHDPSFEALKELGPVFASYVLSFVNVGIYWNNHHHMFHATHRVNAAVLWANLHLLFWLSLVPFATAWMGETTFASLPMATYGVVLLMAGIAYYILQSKIISDQGPNGLVARAVGGDVKGKISSIMYLIAIPTAFVSRWFAGALYVAVALMWLVPDRRIERVLAEEQSDLE
jgi:uncharacterized membrane protein